MCVRERERRPARPRLFWPRGCACVSGRKRERARGRARLSVLSASRRPPSRRSHSHRNWPFLEVHRLSRTRIVATKPLLQWPVEKSQGRSRDD
eukprot:5835697-Pleurochrysis_carterae.AAC.2